MGSPKQENIGQKELKSPTVAEKIRLLEIGKETGQSLNLEGLSEVLEGVKRILLPLVPWLDKPLLLRERFRDCPVPIAFLKKRALHLFGASFLHIWFERSGKWLLWIRGTGERGFFRNANSRQLAEIMVQRHDDFLKNFLRGAGFLDEIPCLKKIAFYNAIFVHVLSQFFKSVEDLIKEREERLCVMREWLELLGDFGKSLDPLISQGKRAVLKNYGIWEETEHGTSNRAWSYFSPDALKPFWEVIEKRGGERSGYKEHIDEYSFKSLFEILQRMGWIVEDIEKAKSIGKADADSLWGYNTGRLPFTEEEMAVLKEFAGSIAPEE